NPVSFIDPMGLCKTVTIYIWTSGVGHGAIDVDGNYLSKFGSGANPGDALYPWNSFPSNYHPASEASSAQKAYTFSVPDDVANNMSNQINSLQTQNSDWNLYNNNCSTDVAGVLRNGGYDIPQNIWTPGYLDVFLQTYNLQSPNCPPPKTPKNPNVPIAKMGTTVLTSRDPNAIVGPSGYGTSGFVQDQGVWPYTVFFENDGSVAAQDVTVSEQLDSNLDWSTFQLGSFGFGPLNVNVPAGLTQYQTTVAYQNVDGSSLNVRVSLDFNVQTGLLTATFTSLDPATGQPPSGVTDGFLPPDNASHVGEGYVQYTVDPKSGLATGATVNAAASVVFDTNAPLTTKTVTNTIDTGAELTSSVAALPAAESSDTFTVSWSGSDPGGSGIASYDVFVSDNGGAFTAFQTATTATSATFTGVNGHTYGFYSVATDNVGNVQPTPTTAQATTTVNPVPFLVTEHTYVIGSGTVTVSAANGLLSGDTGPSQLTVTAGTVTGADGGTFTFNADGSFTYTPGASFPGYDNAQFTVTDTSGDKGTATVNVLSQHAGVVWKFYESVLNRVPDPAGLQYWTNYFNTGGNTGDMA
ncbi:MAG TPA: Ig-like domain-containing protein, partial [Pirellulales bacterium]|nr:Ig-like domain-containing protein [Pirellulales bacterium]